jgi:hypothetical protein
MHYNTQLKQWLTLSTTEQLKKLKNWIPHERHQYLCIGQISQLHYGKHLPTSVELFSQLPEECEFADLAHSQLLFDKRLI